MDLPLLYVSFERMDSGRSRRILCRQLVSLWGDMDSQILKAPTDVSIANVEAGYKELLKETFEKLNEGLPPCQGLNMC